VRGQSGLIGCKHTYQVTTTLSSLLSDKYTCQLVNRLAKYTCILGDKLTYQLAMNLTSRQKLSKLLLDLRGTKSRRAFAREIGVTATAVIAWENTDSEPDMEHLTTIAKMAGYSLDELRAYLGDGEVKKLEKIPFARMLSETSSLSIKEAAALYRAVGDRLVAIAESAGR